MSETRNITLPNVSECTEEELEPIETALDAAKSFCHVGILVNEDAWDNNYTNADDTLICHFRPCYYHAM